MLDVAPGYFGSDEFGLVGADLRFGQRVVVGVAHRTHRTVHAGLDQPLGEGERGVLTTGVGVMDQPAQVDHTGPLAGPDGVLERVEHQIGGHLGHGHASR